LQGLRAWSCNYLPFTCGFFENKAVVVNLHQPTEEVVLCHTSFNTVTDSAARNCIVRSVTVSVIDTVDSVVNKSACKCVWNSCSELLLRRFATIEAIACKEGKTRFVCQSPFMSAFRGLTFVLSQ